MTRIENSVFTQQPELKPRIYCRYVDDCYILADSPEQVNGVRSAFQGASVLNFTTEISNNGKLNFLDVQLSYGSSMVCSQPQCT